MEHYDNYTIQEFDKYVNKQVKVTKQNNEILIGVIFKVYVFPKHIHHEKEVETQYIPSSFKFIENNSSQEIKIMIKEIKNIEILIPEK